MKKLLVLLLAFSFIPLVSQAVIFDTNQVINPPYFGVLMATSSTGKIFASSSPTILYLTATSTTATSTFGYGISIAGGCFAVGATCITSNSGTVTSVAASVPSFLSIAGSPVTTSGTLAISYSGTALPVLNGGTGLTSFTANQIFYANAAGTGLVQVATSSVSSGAGITFSGTAGALVGGSSLTITNTGVISNSCPGGFLSCSGTNPSAFTLGTLSAANGGTGATSLSSSFTVGSNVFQGVVWQHFTVPATASSSWVGTTTFALGTGHGETWNSAQCFTNSGGLSIDFYHASSHLNYILKASSTANIFGFGTNNTMTSGDAIYANIGTTSTETNIYVNCTIKQTN